MVAMFAHATSFNQPIADWRVEKVTGMERMFYSASSFNQPIGTWRVDGVDDMRSMFTGAYGTSDRCDDC